MILLPLLTLLTVTAPALNTDGSPTELAELRFYLSGQVGIAFTIKDPEPGMRITKDIGYSLFRRCYTVTAVGVNGQESAESNRACTRRFSCPVCHDGL